MESPEVIRFTPNTLFLEIKYIIRGKEYWFPENKARYAKKWASSLTYPVEFYKKGEPMPPETGRWDFDELINFALMVSQNLPTVSSYKWEQLFEERYGEENVEMVTETLVKNRHTTPDYGGGFYYSFPNPKDHIPRGAETLEKVGLLIDAYREIALTLEDKEDRFAAWLRLGDVLGSEISEWWRWDSENNTSKA